MSSMGIKVDMFDVPVCNSFQAKILNDQLCYEVDLNQYKDESNIEKYLKVGLVFYMDYNEDRQVVLKNKVEDDDDGSFLGADEWLAVGEGASIFINTIGNKCLYILSISYAKMLYILSF